MKRILAALTAVTLAAGLSLAAVVAPASADDAPVTTPTPVDTSTPTPTPTDAAPTTDVTPPAPVTPLPLTAQSAATSFTTTSQDTPHKAFVCKYVGKPGVDERLQTGQNPIDVSINAIGESPVVVGSYFNDAQGRSYVLALDTGQPDPDVSSCPSPPPACIPDSSVSYTYSNDDSNSGDITVPTVAGSTGKLCKPFYVTATSWSYTGNTVWPQTVDQVDHVNGAPVGGNNIEIIDSGVYHYAAQITCGQGDIYASWTSNDATLFPENDNLPGTGYLAGPGNPLPEHFLHQMGFSGPNPTYRQDNTNCWTPTPETGVPTVSTLSCAVGSSNSLTLPAVPGGVWTVTSADYNHTYAIGTGVTGFTPTFFEQYTIVLTDGSSVDIYDVTGNTTYWTPVNPTSLDCNTITTPEKPTAVAITQCGVDGSITIPDTTGVVYSLDGTVVSAGVISGLSGHHTVTAAPAPGYEFPANTKTSWKFNLHHEKTCPVSIDLGTCSADGNVSSVPVSVTLNNHSSSVSSSFEVQINGVYFDTFVVAAHTTVTESIGSAPTSGETVDVYVNGSDTPVELTVDQFDGCVPQLPGDPHFTQLACTGSTAVGGTATTDGNPNLIYTLSGPGGFSAVFPSLPSTPQITDLADGDYTITVTAQPGFTLSGPNVFPFSFTLAPVDCTGSELTPVLTSVAPTCGPEVDIESTQFSAALVEINGVITIPTDSHMTFTINDGTTTSSISSGDHVEPNGTYTVVATLTSAAIASGFTFGDSPDYTRSAGNTVATWDPIVFSADCLPTLAAWNAGATATDATCSASNLGSITLEHDAGQGDKVDYVVTNDATSAVVYSGTDTANTVLHVPAGHYTVTATPADPADGIAGDAGPYHVTVAAAGVICDGTLAFTGGTIGWFGFVLAGGMLFLGIAFLLMRRRQNRIAE